MTQYGGYGTIPQQGGLSRGLGRLRNARRAEPDEGWKQGDGLRLGRSYHNTVLLPDESMVTIGGGIGFSQQDGNWTIDSSGQPSQSRASKCRLDKLAAWALPSSRIARITQPRSSCQTAACGQRATTATRSRVTARGLEATLPRSTRPPISSGASGRSSRALQVGHLLRPDLLRDDEAGQAGTQVRARRSGCHDARGRHAAARRAASRRRAQGHDGRRFARRPTPRSRRPAATCSSGSPTTAFPPSRAGSASPTRRGAPAACRR